MMRQAFIVAGVLLFAVGVRATGARNEPITVTPDPILSKAETAPEPTAKPAMMTVSTNFLPNDPQDSEAQHYAKEVQENVTMYHNLHNLMQQEREESKRELCRTKCKCIECACCHGEETEGQSDVDVAETSDEVAETSDTDLPEDEDADSDSDSDSDSDESEDSDSAEADANEQDSDESEDANSADADADTDADADADTNEQDSDASEMDEQMRSHYENMLTALREREQRLTRMKERIDSVATADAQERIHAAVQRLHAAHARSEATRTAIASVSSTQ